MDGLQGEELAGQLSAECWLQHELWVLADAEDSLRPQLLSWEVPANKYFGQRHERMENHLWVREVGECGVGGR